MTNPNQNDDMIMNPFIPSSSIRDNIPEEAIPRRIKQVRLKGAIQPASPEENALLWMKKPLRKYLKGAMFIKDLIHKPYYRKGLTIFTNGDGDHSRSDKVVFGKIKLTSPDFYMMEMILEKSFSPLSDEAAAERPESGNHWNVVCNTSALVLPVLSCLRCAEEELNKCLHDDKSIIIS